MFLPCSECNCIRTGTTEGGQASSGSLTVSILRFCRSQPCLHPTTEIPLLILSHIHRQVSVWRTINNEDPTDKHFTFISTHRIHTNNLPLSFILSLLSRPRGLSFLILEMLLWQTFSCRAHWINKHNTGSERSREASSIDTDTASDTRAQSIYPPVTL